MYKMRISSFTQISVLIVLISIPVAAANSSTSAAQSLGPLAAFTYNPCVMCAAPGSIVFFNANTSFSPTGRIFSYTWNFGDGSPLSKTTSPYATHDFLLVSPGKWLVTLTIQDILGGTDTVSQLVIFNIAPLFNYHPTHPMVQQTVTFNASGTRNYTTPGTIEAYKWNFGDNTNGTGIIAKHVYISTGIFRVTLLLVTTEGNPSISQNIIIQPHIIIVHTNFDGLDITVTGVFTVNATSRTISGSITITAVNSTTGATVYTNTFDITLPLTNNFTQFILTIPNSPIPLGAICTVDSTAQASSFVSRDPDIAHHGIVDIADAAQLAVSFGASQGSPMYNPSADLDGDGTVNLVDASILAYSFGTPIIG